MMDMVMMNIPKEKRVFVGADCNGHVEGNRGDEEIMGTYGVGERNNEGEMIIDCSTRGNVHIEHIFPDHMQQWGQALPGELHSM